MALGDPYVEEEEASDEGAGEAAAATAAAATEAPPGAPRVSRAPKEGFYLLARQDARTSTPAGSPQKRQDYMMAQAKEVAAELGGLMLQKPQAVQVSFRQGKQTKMVSTGLVHLVTKPRASWPLLAVTGQFYKLIAGSWALRSEAALADCVYPVPHGVSVPAVVAYVGAALVYDNLQEGEAPDPKLVFLD